MTKPQTDDLMPAGSFGRPHPDVPDQSPQTEPCKRHGIYTCSACPPQTDADVDGSIYEDYPPEQTPSPQIDKITCVSCGKKNVPDWDGKGHCIKCARDIVLDRPQTDVGSKIQDLRPLEHKKCSVQFVAVDTSQDVATNIYHCVDHNVNYKVSIPVTPPPQTEQPILVAPTKETQQLWQKQYPTIKVVLSQKVPLTSQTEQKIEELLKNKDSDIYELFAGYSNYLWDYYHGRHGITPKDCQKEAKELITKVLTASNIEARIDELEKLKFYKVDANEPPVYVIDRGLVQNRLAELRKLGK